MNLIKLKFAEGAAGSIGVRCKITGNSVRWNDAVEEGWFCDSDGEPFKDYYSPEGLSRQEALAEYEQKREQIHRLEEQEECPHDENDHGICLDCGKDVWDDVVAAAEFRADCLEDR